MELASTHRAEHRHFSRSRPLLRFAASGLESALAEAILDEERKERAADREYWAPLKAELERLRLARPRTARREKG